MDKDCGTCGTKLEPITIVGYNMWAKVPKALRDKSGSKRYQVETMACGDCGLITFWYR